MMVRYVHLAIGTANRATLWNTACYLVITCQIFIEQMDEFGATITEASGLKKSAQIYSQVNGKPRHTAESIPSGIGDHYVTPVERISCS